MRRLLPLLLVAGLIFVGSSAIADEHQELPQHPHILLIDFEVIFGPGFPEFTSVRKCVDIANNQRLRLNAHHEHVHFGPGNDGLIRGDNLMIPTAPFPIGPDTVVPWTDCRTFLRFYGLG